MANRNINYVRVNLHKSYFDNVFEPERKKLQNRLGVKLTQPKFTEYLAKSKVSTKTPKKSNFSAKVNMRGYNFRL